jgi:serine/threonine protein kinase/Tol biopolymer transport system component
LIGKKLGHYEITATLGKGGMGEVYRARDLTLGRDVAIKVLPADMSEDPERLARFEREARTLATLQHSNIASIYGFEIADNVRFLVMELVDGDDLSQHLRLGSLAVDDVVDQGIQMAEGLAAAHAVGIIHRDLKPANIQVSPEGQLKILDFGLARTYIDEHVSGTDLQHSPTLTRMTEVGMILGTAAYMAPEQARGKRADHRSDIWSYGVVLFEMLTGQRLFEGETVSDTLAGVLRADVPWDQLPKDTPPTLRRLLERCLERDPSRRLQAIAEARISLEDLKAGSSVGPVQQPVAEDGPRPGRERLLWMVAVVALTAVIAALVFLPSPEPDLPLVQSTLLPPEGWDFAPASPFAVSPDGSQVAYVAIARPDNESTAAGSNSIWVLDLASPEPRQLTNTDGDAYPFWSPDGRWLGFFANGKLNKIEARGGPVIPLCVATTGRGGSWNTDGIILFQRAWSEGLMKVPAAGGTAEPVTTLNKDHFEIAHRWPSFLPDGQHFLFFVVSTANPAASEFTGLYVGSLESNEVQQLLKSDSRALYAREQLLYRAGSTLMAHPFDVSRQRFTGEPIPLTTDVPGGSISWGGAQFGTSESGVLVHMRGAQSSSTLLRWRDRDGEVVKIISDPAGYWEPRLSNDGTRIATTVGQDVGDVWIYDLTREMRTRFTFDPADDRTPLWSPDDSQVAFVSSRGSEGEIYVRPISGQGDARLLYSAGEQIALTDWSSDGRLLFFDRVNPDEGGSDIWTLDVETAEATRLLSGSWIENARLSPDGKWLAFNSDESGKAEIYVQPFPASGGRWMISNDGAPGRASVPSWRADSRELFYMRGAEIIAVSVMGDAGFSFGTPEALFGVSVTSSKVKFSVSTDGQQILTNELPPTDQSRIGARLILNWSSALTR